jgi:hypothetical protein
MTWYTIYPDDDKKQTDGNAITASSTRVVGGTSVALGTAVPADTPITANLQLGDRRSVFSTQVIQSKNVFGAFQSSPVAITSVADDGSGFCDFTLATHGLSVGDVVNVTGSTNGNVDGPQTITSVPDVNSFVTDKAYVASASAGSYTLVAGTFATMTAAQYVMLGYSSSIAGGQATRKGFGADYGIRRSIHKLEHMYSRLVATAIRAGNWNIYTGMWSTDPTVQDDAPTWGTDDAAAPTRPIPGELTYRTSGQQDGSTGYGVTEDDYEAKTS